MTICMKHKASFVLVLACALLVNVLGQAQTSANKQQAPQAPPPSSTKAPDYSGMYTFLREGEFVQLTVEESSRVTGFISRYGNLESDKDAFLDQFFKEGKLEDRRVTFSTQTVHGVWFDFKGSVERGEGKSPSDEAYYILRGTLTENSTDDHQKVSSRSREVTFKSFPQDLAPTHAQKD